MNYIEILVNIKLFNETPGRGGGEAHRKGEKERRGGERNIANLIKTFNCWKNIYSLFCRSNLIKYYKGYS